MKKLGKKKYIIISIAIILVIALSAALFLRGSIRAPALLTAKVQKELAIWPQYADSKVWWTEDDPVGHVRYYGTYNGWHIISESTWEDPEDLVIGEYTFPMNARVIYAVKDTETAGLSKLYEDGVLDDKDIAKIYKHHMYAEEMEDKFLAEHTD